MKDFFGWSSFNFVPHKPDEGLFYGIPFDFVLHKLDEGLFRDISLDFVPQNLFNSDSCPDRKPPFCTYWVPLL